MLLLWILYTGIFLVRSKLDDPHRRGRVRLCLHLWPSSMCRSSLWPLAGFAAFIR